MSSEFDLVIRGGMIVDGSGGVPFVGDVAISDGLIRQTGLVEGIGTQELDATARWLRRDLSIFIPITTARSVGKIPCLRHRIMA